MKPLLFLMLVLLAGVSHGQTVKAHVALLKREGATTESMVSGIRQTLGTAVQIKIWSWPALDAGVLDKDMKRFDPHLVICMDRESVNWTRAHSKAPILATMFLKEADFTGLTGVTGVYLEFPIQRKLELLAQETPSIKSVGILHNPDQNQAQVEQAVKAGGALGIRINPIAVPRPSALPGGLVEASNRDDAMIGIFDDVVLTPHTARAILAFSLQNRLPFVGVSHSWVKAGALFAFDRDYEDMGRQLGEMARRIVLDGVPVAEIKPEPPRSARLGVNLKTAKRMKLKLSPEFIKNVALVIE